VSGTSSCNVCVLRCVSLRSDSTQDQQLLLRDAHTTLISRKDNPVIANLVAGSNEQTGIAGRDSGLCKMGEKRRRSRIGTAELLPSVIGNRKLRF
jgi:hypothetical protein